MISAKQLSALSYPARDLAQQADALLTQAHADISASAQEPCTAGKQRRLARAQVDAAAAITHALLAVAVELGGGRS